MSGTNEAPCNLHGSRFLNICLANWLVHVHVFQLIPLISAHAAASLPHVSTVAAWAVLAFALGMMLPGPFGAHLMERYSRKHVGLWSVFMMGLLAVPVTCLPQAPASLAMLYGLQGLFFGLAQTALGSTLVNDVLLSHERDRGDIVYAWAGRLGIPLGLFLGGWLPWVTNGENATPFVLAPCAIAFLLIAQTSVPLKAPVPVAVMSLDRFLLLRSLPLALSLFAAPFVLGHVVAHDDPSRALPLLAGFVAVALLQRFLRQPLEQRASVWLGYALIIVGLAILCCHSMPDIACWPALLSVGAGVAEVSSRHLLHWITLARHCQRGTAQNTYMLSWRVAFTLGYACTLLLPDVPGPVLPGLALASALYYWRLAKIL